MRSALFIAASNVAVLVAVLVVVARRGPPSWFPYALWGGLLLVGSHAVAVAFRLQKLWMPLDRVARWVDREAGLDDRLATLCAGPTRLDGSRFAPLLLTQTLALGGRWDPRTVVPRAFPRSALVLGASLLTLALATLIPPRDPEPGENRPDSTQQAGAQPKQEDTRRNGTTEGANGGRPDFEGPHAYAASHAAPQGDQSAFTSGGSEANRTLPGGQDASLTEPGAPAGRASASGERSDVETNLAGDLREMIRDLATAETRPGAKHSATEQAPKSRQELARASDRETENPSSDRNDGASGRSDPTRLGRRHDPEAAGGEGSQQEQTSGSAGGSRAAREGGGEGRGGVFGRKSVEPGKGSHPETFSLRLSAVMSNAPTEFEPQQPRPAPAAGSGARPFADPADVEAQAPDDPLHKTEIAPEYEEILRRVFNRR